MTKKELYELLDIDSPSDFQYFENLAELLECDDEIQFEILAELIKGVNKDTLSILIDNYFDEILNYVPGAETEIFTIFENVKNSLCGMARNIEDENMETKFVEEIERFRIFYSIESKVYLTDKKSFEETEVTLRNAIVQARIDKLDGEKYMYDFSECMEYPIDEYIMSFSDMINLADEEEKTDDNYGF